MIVPQQDCTILFQFSFLLLINLGSLRKACHSIAFYSISYTVVYLKRARIKVIRVFIQCFHSLGNKEWDNHGLPGELWQKKLYYISSLQHTSVRSDNSNLLYGSWQNPSLNIAKIDSFVNINTS